MHNNQTSIEKESKQLCRLVSRKFLPLKVCYNHPNRRVIIRPYEMKDAVAVQQAVEETLPILKKFMCWAFIPTNVAKQAERLERYSLIPEDRMHLPWYAPLVDHLTVTTRWGADLPLREIIHSTNPPSV